MEKNLKIFEALDACADRLEQLNESFPRLASKSTRESVNHWRNRKQVMRDSLMQEEEEKAPGEVLDIKALATELLMVNGLEDVLDILLDEHGIDITMQQLVHEIGKTAYLSALRKDAGTLLSNAISYDQIATLWNDLGRPALGGPKWNARSVSILVE
jgi:hypothetical protein